jgi:hypothetical protein
MKRYWIERPEFENLVRILPLMAKVRENVGGIE